MTRKSHRHRQTRQKNDDQMDFFFHSKFKHCTASEINQLFRFVFFSRFFYKISTDCISVRCLLQSFCSLIVINIIITLVERYIDENQVWHDVAMSNTKCDCVTFVCFSLIINLIHNVRRTPSLSLLWYERFPKVKNM